ncbi:MAG: trypsin-like peptidase domain-containing protein [Planctomycetes bacterium]|nr:trypsin-like peptidase domain-containing protein [Planctomycetota bacterium]
MNMICWNSCLLLWLGLLGQGQGPATLEDLIRQVSPAVVALRVERDPEPELDPNILPPRVRRLLSQDEDLRDYFKRPPGPASGLLLDSEGHVLTTLYNVSGGLRKVTVILSSGQELPARLVSRDPADDLALLRIENRLPKEAAVPEVRWGSEENLVTGGFVLAIGRSPDPGHPTATLGIVSAPARNGGRVFQTDAPLNYGNVGGALFDLDGRVLGIAAFIGHLYPQWGQNSGIGFGIRADLIQKLLPQMRRGEDIPPPETALLGVSPSGSRDRPGRAGMKVERIAPGSAAERGGLKAGDVILEFDRVPLEDFSHLKRLVLSKRPGDEVLLKVQRNEETIDLKIKLGRRSLN